MGFWSTLGEAAKGVLSSAVPDRAARLCAAAGWTVDDRMKDGTAVLHFTDAGVPGGKRHLYVTEFADGVLRVVAPSYSSIPARKVPDGFAAEALVDNRTQTYGAWEAHVDDDDDTVTLWLTARLIGSDIPPAHFKAVCTDLASEVAKFDAALRDAGLFFY